MNKMAISPYAIAAGTLVAAACLAPAAPPALAGSGAREVLEEVFVIGRRRAYQGNFAALENPSAAQLIDGELLREAGALNLNDALDLSASVARQNNFGGLWNSFSLELYSPY